MVFGESPSLQILFFSAINSLSDKILLFFNSCNSRNLAALSITTLNLLSIYYLSLSEINLNTSFKFFSLSKVSISVQLRILSVSKGKHLVNSSTIVM